MRIMFMGDWPALLVELAILAMLFVSYSVSSVYALIRIRQVS